MQNFLTLDNQLCFAIYETNSQFTKLYSNVLQSFGITYPQYLVLLALWEKDEITLKELGERLNLGTGTLTPMIKRMEANGWIKRERMISDERKVAICLQEKAINQKDDIHQAIANEVIACQIDLNEYQLLMDQLKILQNKLTIRSSN
ncbi:DNA-binding MarR family transcriptional regulator [Gracilibacillus halotolerans]|uniref:HTH-type transcriptional regulator SarZ n=1 Tax=Gracilibacillus halotolerans TaxID=74386 RepID=A0A841RKM3_9BACI|nr:MarR family transcriptional regulator [Gracilibacillus halotolerans]MBB6512026.1 DNA-binding MarR family transcriptional regulator [Gracilibacillus halotolerans]